MTMQGTREVKVDIAGTIMHGDRFDGWGIVDLPGWGAGAEVRADPATIPSADGLFPFPAPLVGGLSFSVIGEYITTSTEQAVRARDWVRALAKLDPLPVRIREASRWVNLRGAQINGRVTTSIDYFFGGGRLRFEVPIRTADARLYGEPAPTLVLSALAEPSGGLAFPVVDGALNFGAEGLVEFPGAFRITNPGTADFHPVYTATGPMSGFTITSESDVLEYGGPVGAGQELVLSPYLGGRAVLDGADVSHNLVRADWTPVAGGETRGYLFTPASPGAGAQLRVDYPLGAWY